MSQSHKPPSNMATILFVVVLCCSCALVLSVLASVLRVPQEQAAMVDRAKQTLLAARIIHYDGYFLIQGEDGSFVPAKHSGEGMLIPGSEDDIASSDDILTVMNRRIQPALIDGSGQFVDFKTAGIDPDMYAEENRMVGFTGMDYKLLYKILPNDAGRGDSQPDGYILPVVGFGLWNKIIGYVAVEPNGIFVRGVAWYWHRETPGLGGDIVEPWWQKQFLGKSIFQFADDSIPNIEVAPAGINVVRGKVADVFGDGPRSRNAVDGISGATLTGVGVTKAYKETVDAYRPFLVNVHRENTDAGMAS